MIFDWSRDLFINEIYEIIFGLIVMLKLDLGFLCLSGKLKVNLSVF